jgi:purine-binding chemotaxis protein CheW
MNADRPEILPERRDPTVTPATDGGSALASPVTRVRACLVVVGGEQFAVDVRCLREVMVVEKPTAVPGAPAFVRGVANLRGEVIAILDIASVLGLPPSRVGPSGKALVLEPAASQVAIAVDEVLGLETFDESHSRHDDPVSTGYAAFERGWVEREGTLVTLLDVPGVVEALRIQSREAAGSRS